MKKLQKVFLSFLLSLLMIFSLVGCTSDSTKSSETQTPEKKVLETTPEGFRVMTVGSGTPELSLEQGGASTLVQYQDKYFLVDCGFNSIQTLMKNGLNVTSITNMLFTHQHNDHNADFWAFFIGGWGSTNGRRSLNLIGPGVQSLYDLTTAYYKTDLEYRVRVEGTSDGVLTNVNITDFTQPQYSMVIDGVTITAIPVPHTISTYAYRFEAGGQSVVVSGDMTYLDTFASFAKDADILVMDGIFASDWSTIPEDQQEGLKIGLSKSHITNEDIGKIAADAGVKNLVLTHHGIPQSVDDLKAVYSKAGYDGEVTVAYDGMVVEP